MSVQSVLLGALRRKYVRQRLPLSIVLFLYADQFETNVSMGKSAFNPLERGGMDCILFNSKIRSRVGNSYEEVGYRLVERAFDAEVRSNCLSRVSNPRAT